MRYKEKNKMDKPSYLTSTFSIMTLVVLIGFTGLAIWLKDISSLKEVVMILLGAYGLKKGMESNQPKNGDSNAPKII